MKLRNEPDKTQNQATDNTIYSYTPLVIHSII